MVKTQPSLFHNLLKRFHTIGGFAVVGVSNTLLDFAVLNGLHRLGVAVPAAVAAGFAVGAVNGYLLNSHFVFRQEWSYQRFLKYLAINLVGLYFTELIINFLHLRGGHLGLNEAKLVAVAMVFCWNYGMSKLWAFR